MMVENGYEQEALVMLPAELIKITYGDNGPVASGRELHEFLGVNSNYTTWFKRMCEYGFMEGVDYEAVFQKWNTAQGNETTQIDHLISVDMAKQIGMLQRNDKGKQCREYFLQIEKAWNSPEAIMSRALQLANQRLARLTRQRQEDQATIAVQVQQIAELQPKASYTDLVLSCQDAVNISVIAKDYGWSAQKMNEYLNKKGIQFKQSGIWLLYQKYAPEGYTKTNTTVQIDKHGKEHTHVHTKWTQKGRLFIYNTLLANNILPLIELSA